MKILTAEQIRALDQCSMKREPITSLDLMERAATRLVEALRPKLSVKRPVVVVSGSGNNGGDGLVIARKLRQQGHSVTAIFIELGSLSDDCAFNGRRLSALLEPAERLSLREGDAWPDIPADAVLVDALFGSGLNRPAQNWVGYIIDSMNQHPGLRIAVDIPSGLFADSGAPQPGSVFRAHRTYTFQLPKKCFLWKETQNYLGHWQVIDIGLHPECLREFDTHEHMLSRKDLQAVYRPRSRFSHKGHYGHALLIGGNPGKAGALVMAVEACLRGGAGLTSAIGSRAAAQALGRLPEAMLADRGEQAFIQDLPDDLDSFQAVGIGPGLGRSAASYALMEDLLSRYRRPLVLDADALNILAEKPKLLDKLPPGSILTPHPGEWKRLLGGHLPPSTPEVLQKIDAFVQRRSCVALYKVAFTVIVCPDGRRLYNTTGHPGMATGGMGDVLCGLLTALLAQGYPPEEAACLGVWLHGQAADLALDQQSHESLLPGDVIQHLGRAFRSVAPDAH